MMRIAIAAALVALASSGARAQTAADTLGVLVTAFDSVMGAPRFGHPGGGTPRVCLGSGPAGPEPVPANPEWPPRDPVSVGPSYHEPLSEDLLGRLGRTLSSTRLVDITSGCHRVDPRPYTRSRTVDSAGIPAMSVRLGLQFTARDVAWVFVALPSRLVECVLRRSNEEPWRATCRTILVS